MAALCRAETEALITAEPRGGQLATGWAAIGTMGDGIRAQCSQLCDAVKCGPVACTTNMFRAGGAFQPDSSGFSVRTRFGPVAEIEILGSQLATGAGTDGVYVVAVHTATQLSNKLLPGFISSGQGQGQVCAHRMSCFRVGRSVWRGWSQLTLSADVGEIAPRLDEGRLRDSQ